LKKPTATGNPPQWVFGYLLLPYGSVESLRVICR